MTAASFSSAGLPLALRDTALTVTSLAGAAQPQTYVEFAAQCDKQIADLRKQLATAGQANDVINDAVYAQCALLDETALTYLQGADRDTWEREPLQVRYFNSHDAGDALIQRIEQRLTEPQPVMPLLAIFSAVLGLGFQGKFALLGETARTTLMRAVNERLDGKAGRDLTSNVLVRQGTARRFGGLSPLAWVLLACAMSGLVYVGAQHWLTVSIDALAH
ncbi:DotU/TssL family secretion system protein [Ralstonia flaminis]|nr:DotU/TssL family secretion system protein [Ralstonia sp. LMG 18101]